MKTCAHGGRRWALHPQRSFINGRTSLAAFTFRQQRIFAEYQEGFQKHLQHFPKDDAPPSKKRKTGGARKRLDVEEHAALTGNNNDEHGDDDELEMLMLVEIYLIMDELKCKDIVDVILKHEHLLRERLNCNYEDLERLVRRRSADTLNDLHSIITSSLDGDGEK